MTQTQQLILVVIIAAGTALTRFLPFLLFPDNRPVPGIVASLGRLLPPAVFGLLVVYCLRGVSVLSAPHGLPELISLSLVIGLHLWKRRMLLSIVAGTVCYMLLVQLIF